MSDDCIFCAIASGDAPGYRVREGDDVVAFLDANPLARGHTLVVPRDHHQRLQDVPDETAAALFDTVHDVVPAVEAAVDADATNVGINNGEVAGQVVQHVHCHVIPRFEGDGGRPIHAVAASQEDLSDDELATVAADVRAER
jgi:histidine triad (HIT) family protein